MNKSISLQRKFDRLSTIARIGSIPAALIFLAQAAILVWFYLNISSDNLGPEWLALLVAACIVALGVFHLVVLWALWVSSRASESPSIIRSAAIAFGCVSLVSLAVSAVALSDIGHQAEAGLSSSGEWAIILINNTILLFFLIFSFSSLPVFKKKPAAPFVINDDILFITVNEVGFLSSLFAVCAIIFGMISPVMEQYRGSVILIYTMISFTPWGIMLIGWFLSRIKKVARWWDEKQMRDIGRAAFISLILVVLAAVALYTVGLLVSSFNPCVIWFPSVVVTAVLSFSGFNTVFSRWG